MPEKERAGDEEGSIYSQGIPGAGDLTGGIENDLISPFHWNRDASNKDARRIAGIRDIF